VEQKLHTLPEHLSSPPVFSGVRVTRSLVLCVCLVKYKGFVINLFLINCRSYGYIVGIVVASITFLLIVVIVVITVCASCTKSAGTSGRIIHPVNTPRGVAVVYCF
jgi:hypothetical protein